METSQHNGNKYFIPYKELKGDCCFLNIKKEETSRNGNNELKGIFVNKGIYNNNNNEVINYYESDEEDKLPIPSVPSEEMPISNMNGDVSKQVYKLVLTGGPCGGKTTGQERLATFFEGLGWKVFTVPEAASVLLRGRTRFQEFNPEQSYQFQKDLLLTILQLEQVYFNQAKMINGQNVLIICDRGALDPSAYMEKSLWVKLLGEIKKDVFDLRDNRYNQIVHVVTAADGAEQYYTCLNNKARTESMEEALVQDRKTREAWIGHQCLSIVDNSDCQNFNDKIMKLIRVVTERIGISFDRLAKHSKKRKCLPEPVETRKQLSRREFEYYLEMRDRKHAEVHKKRRCFTYGNVYFHLDIFVQPLPPACIGSPIILETYTTRPIGDPSPSLPSFLEIVREVTGEPAYSMFHMTSSNQTVVS
ncbi:AAA_28 domain-containing protein [Meloidogyne graminicola]|uniref:AAA_28 domain-containing protein n=1 Tax=Meloidogyne graminicola TaxID=189291 RepID=A0A8S9ZSB0_9BILA|nr:AAA_28 domain-containing protein [Meloidogyne graminicola]